jgi:hypothetical protein
MNCTHHVSVGILEGGGGDDRGEASESDKELKHGGGREERIAFIKWV